MLQQAEIVFVPPGTVDVHVTDDVAACLATAVVTGLAMYGACGVLFAVAFLVVALKPGVLRDYFRGNPNGDNPIELLKARDRISPAYRDRDVRLDQLDDLFIAAAGIEA